MNQLRWSRIAAVAILSAGVLPFTHAAASADDDPVAGQDGTAQSTTTFKVSCGAYSNGGTAGQAFHDEPVDIFGKDAEMGVHTTYPRVVTVGETFTYSLQFDSLKLKNVFEDGATANGVKGSERMKVDIDIPEGVDFVSAEAGDEWDIIRIDDDGRESDTGKHLRLTFNNATEQRTKNGVVTNNGPNASAHDDGGFNSFNLTINFPEIRVTVKPSDNAGEISPTIRVGKSANEYNDPKNFFTFLTTNHDNTLFFPHSGYVSLRCSPRDTPDADVNNGVQPLATIKVVDPPIYGLDGRVIDIVDDGTVSGTPVQMWDNTGAENQQWTMHTGGGGTQIVNPHTQKCLDVHEGTAVNSLSDLFPNGAPIQISGCGTQTSDEWFVSPEVTDGNPVGGTIVNAPSGKCLDVTDSESANGTRLQLWDCTGGPNQQFNFPPPFA
ncbi:RICIN domain-containing protein [Rhodococcus marinonascens]|uniref:RICIN domain-containing protein n=1 Tax=Rhodococcus marinonascens TaxID=38311 RepID=UPI000A06922F|nr:RICIN domain-containing protein [Rhodococcus marinonascens]